LVIEFKTYKKNNNFYNGRLIINNEIFNLINGINYLERLYELQQINHKIDRINEMER
jgi:hypothetical protein